MIFETKREKKVKVPTWASQIFDIPRHVFSLTLIQPGEVKDDLANFDVKSGQNS
jgi:hypothetical protein